MAEIELREDYKIADRYVFKSCNKRGEKCVQSYVVYDQVITLGSKKIHVRRL